MGVSIDKRLNEIFRNEDNFDISGFCRAELITEDMAKELMEICGNPKTRDALSAKGFDIYTFGIDGESGLILKMTRHGKFKESLKIYWDQKFPKEMNTKRKEEE